MRLAALGIAGAFLTTVLTCESSALEWFGYAAGLY